MTMLKLARTNAEAHIYMTQRPCACGATAFAGTGPSSAVVELDGDLASRYDGTCASCGAARRFEFRIPEKILPPPPRGVRFGGDEPSQLLDPGEWLIIADEHAKRVPAHGGGALGGRIDPHERAIAVAIAAIDEIFKFYPKGADAPPEAAFTTERGRAVFAAEPGRFRRARLQAVRDTYARMLDQN